MIATMTFVSSADSASAALQSSWHPYHVCVPGSDHGAYPPLENQTGLDIHMPLLPEQAGVSVAISYYSSGLTPSNEAFGHRFSMGIGGLAAESAGIMCCDYSLIYSRFSGRLQEIRKLSGGAASIRWENGIISSIQDSSHCRTTFQYDTSSAHPLSLLTTVILSNGDSIGLQHSNTSIGETKDWLLTGMIQPDGACTSFLYNMEGMIHQANPLRLELVSFLHTTGMGEAPGGNGHSWMRPASAPSAAVPLTTCVPITPPLATDAQYAAINRAARACCRSAGLRNEDAADCESAFMRKMLVLLKDDPGSARKIIAERGRLRRCAANFANDYADHLRATVYMDLSIEDLNEEIPLSAHALAASQQTPEDKLQTSERNRLVRRAISELKFREQELFMRHAALGERLIDIANATGRTPNAVSKEFRRIVQRLKARLTHADYFGIEPDIPD